MSEIEGRYSKEQVEKAIWVAFSVASYTTAIFSEITRGYLNAPPIQWLDKIRENYEKLRSQSNSYAENVIRETGIDPELAEIVLKMLNDELLQLMKNSMDTAFFEIALQEIRRMADELDKMCDCH